ncbi:hypothetical protein GHK29_11195 [Sinorhizobium medicae]|uniref:endonuclease/exonuclease/phosphatase family protein n=1 Tax=Sinorhizobium medicae TaxID=110321 RepID=UPI0011A18D83|nr:hypothetical protein [Sinorhizobium medicae]MQU75208.1 hypothetical protein [Sinorhizobium medicae]
MSLPGNPNADRPRPSLSVDLTIDGELVRILAVHLKSSCVSPLEASGNLSDDQDRDCRLLQQQIVPLETWLEDLASTDKFIVLGDFNRNFWHEVHETGPVRTDGSSPHMPLPPPASWSRICLARCSTIRRRRRLSHCFASVAPLNSARTMLCEKGEAGLLTADERRQLSQSQNLGCRNPLGLDHILIGRGLVNIEGAEHVAIGAFGGTKPASGLHPDPLLAISDHCPLSARLDF